MSAPISSPRFKRDEVPFYARDLDLKIQDPKFKLRLGPWKQIPNKEKRHRLVGFLEMTLVDPRSGQIGTHEYSVVQIETRTKTPDESIYQSRVLVGDIVGKDQERRIFESNGVDRMNLWCSHCWHESYVSGQGGYKIPSYTVSRYFSGLRYMQPCSGCRKQVASLDDQLYLEGSTTIFSAFLHEEVTAFAEAALLPHGIVCGIWRRDRIEDQLTDEQKQEVLAGAMHPKRVGCLLEAHGFDAVEAVFG